MTKQIVILGAGLGAIAVLTSLMKNVILKSSDYKVVLVAPNTHFHWPLAMPRVVVPGQISSDKVLVLLSEKFKNYPASKFEHVVGKADNLDPEAKSVTVGLNGGGSKTVSYDYLVIATGSSAIDDMPWKLVESAEKTRTIIDGLHADIKRAKKIVVSGGGATGAETAGELGSEYGKDGSKEIYYIFSGEYPLMSLVESARKVAKTTLEAMNVKLIPNTTVANVTTNEAGDKVLELKGKDGKVETLTAQAYLPAIGLIPNSAFAPKSMLDGSGQIKQTSKLQAEGHEDIFIVGDVGSLEVSRAITTDSQAKHVIKTLEEILTKKATAQDYKLNTMDGIAVTLGRSKGTGQMSGWKLPSIMVWFLKGRTLMVEAIDKLFI